MEVTKRLEIDAGHRLMQHEGKCRSLHGHRYVFELTISSPALDAVGRVLDFGIIKQVVGGWLDEHWDHAFIAQANDPILNFVAKDGTRCYILADPPTAENLSRYLFQTAARLLKGKADIVRVRCYETPNCWSDYAGA